MRKLSVLGVALLGAGCLAANSGSDCEWPADHQARVLDLTLRRDRRHVADDAQTAEDLAIRHADASRSPGWQRDRAQYQHTREECRARLNLLVSQQHSVPADSVAAAVADRRIWLDVLVLVAFSVLFVTLAAIATAWLLHGALREARALAAVVLLAASLGAGAIGVLGSSVFIGVIESLRIGNGHMSYRVDRLPLRHRRVETFAMGAVCFIVVGAVQFRRRQAN